MPSSIVRTSIYCGPNKWNNQGPLIDAASAAGGIGWGLKRLSREKPGKSPGPRAVINERRRATNYNPNRKTCVQTAHACLIVLCLSSSPTFFLLNTD